jgi:hypothetical protein
MAKKKKNTDPVDVLINYVSKKRRKGNQKIESLWDPYRDGITYSLLSKFMGCRERTRLSYVEGWISKNFSVPLEFGNLFHLLKEVRYSGASMKASLKSSEKYIQSKIKKNNLSALQINELECLRGLAVVTFEEYCNYWNETPTFISGRKKWCDNNIVFQHIERTFRHPFTLSNGKIITLTGKIDGELIDPISKKYRILENKTKQRVEEVDIETLLKNDTQTTMYLLANKLSFNAMPDGVIYNVIRRTSMKPRKNELAEDYVSRIGTDIRSRPDFYFMRWKVDITEDDLNRFIDKSLDPMMCQLVEWWESIKDNPFDPWKTREKNGKSKKNVLHHMRPFGMYGGGARDLADDFKEIIVNGDYSEFEQRDVVFPELVEE